MRGAVIDFCEEYLIKMLHLPEDTCIIAAEAHPNRRVVSILVQHGDLPEYDPLDGPYPKASPLFKVKFDDKEEVSFVSWGLE